MKEKRLDFWQLYGEAAKTAVGFFWKAGWAFVLGYFVSGMIQAFVPKKKLTRYMGSPDFGAASSSCSFAALATARSLVLKGAHFVVAVAFMFASTNLVIELGVLILIFLGWQFMVAEVIGGFFLIVISSVLIRATYPKTWIEAARRKVEEAAGDEEEDFDWRKRIGSRMGWHLVGHKFVMEWKMVWEEITIGFTIAGFVAVLVPASLWETIFLINMGGPLPQWLIVLENAAVAPFVAALTFIGSMGNIPLATVLNSNGVIFAGIMGFIYSDLIVPPLVAVNGKYYGIRVALYIALIMYISILITAVSLHFLFLAGGITPETERVVREVTRFRLDYTFWLNLLAAAGSALLFFHHRQHLREHEVMSGMSGEGGLTFKRVTVCLFILIVLAGLLVFVFSE
jgi:uncharacterized membrane protein YraQ (UPF0718 family)